MSQNKVIIAGGGLVGSLAACYFAKRGWIVELYERSPDPRKSDSNERITRRSINLAISTRGLSAINRVDPDLKKKVMDIVLPMYGRMIHDLDGKLNGQSYSPHGEFINSIDRGLLNQILLTECEKYPTTTIFFEHSLESCNFENKTAVFKNIATGQDITASADLIIGADGAWSTARRYLQYSTRVNLEQTYIEHAYCELEMKPKNGEFAMVKDHLHIWPRKTFMLIALPNLDKSFTCTLFMPWSKFNSIKTEEDLFKFFEEYFPDSIPLFGKEGILEYFKNPKGPLFYVKCTPHHYKGNGVIVGDAAHCTVPFYAQGMNCGFEDIEILDTLLVEQAAPLVDPTDNEATKDVKTNRLTNSQIEAALIKYTACRPRDSASMIDLAMHNYVEMRHSVSMLSYKIRNWIEKKLHLVFPKTIIPLYSMVSFSKMSYTNAVAQWNKQTDWLRFAINSITRVSLITAAFFAIKYGGPRLGYRLPAISEITKLIKK
ncbi:hypothetical protein BB559_004413 [Furculomyces boomerangus]|uniref:Kynurenine 3-monooxygenase n=2 Tax=Harpellales TaxID=61421 RepID=A0A2T9YEQ7_9FUNG|nr:hypothetical protein BB559_004413 [Furculomyces boomerangus]